ncbi:hypothetical protein ACWDV7_26815 [Streptomyces sp. NPDC003362]
MRDYGIHSVGLLVAMAPSTVQRLLGGRASRLAADRARGIGPRPVVNVPRKPQLDTEDLDVYPVHLRVVDAGTAPNWCLKRARVTVVASDGSRHRFDNLRLDKVADNRRIWLGEEYGQHLYLRRVAQS